eukprot:TRINITY_DN2661_c0_g1_i1.p1 TRINITY_DN2661_c0_g1~~TRINITY_DN2661_c0_g1_i1.p1  ORF type:complete len:301 (+),score=109.19 TRINITY_DN2661_c0_g1_i1:70-972(+)
MSSDNAQLSHRILHWVFKVSDLKAWLDFSSDLLKSKVYRHEEFDAGCEATCNGPYQGSWSKTMVGPSDEKKHFCIELTYNYGISEYQKGNELNWITLQYPGATQHAKSHSSKWKTEEREDGSVLVTGPDAQVWRFVEGPALSEGGEPFHSISLNTVNLQESLKYYTQVLGMTNFAQEGEIPTVGYGKDQTKLQLIQVQGPIDHKTARGRVAFSTSSVPVIYKRAVDANTKVLNHPTTLPTPGKADVVVTILKDFDDNEICQVNVEGFDALSTLKEGDEIIDWTERDKKNAAIQKWNDKKQ